MPKSVPIFRGTTGLNNAQDPTRLKLDLETGLCELATAINVEIDETFRPSRRKGFSLTTGGAFSGLFSAGPYGLCVKDGSLCVLDPDGSTTALQSINQDARIRYARVRNRVYWLNGEAKGYVQDRAAYAWEGEDYVGPTTQKTFSDPPIGHLLAVWNGRMFIGSDDVIWYSQPFAYAWFDLARNFAMMPSRVRMIAPVRNGLYVSTEEETFFLYGNDAKELGMQKVADIAAVEGTEIAIPGYQVAGGQISKEIAQVWTSKEGICIGWPDGMFDILTKDRLVLPDIRFGAAFLRGNHYIVTLEP